ncbi:MAG TPA: Xaa-Pro peptidase family protein [Verrucomicrobiota bacterium]|nr:Xaa-Pro peptidase family protein [Verrucomicrobiota bacterium]
MTDNGRPIFACESSLPNNQFSTQPNQMNFQNILLVASGQPDPNMLYATGLITPGPAIYFRHQGRCYCVLSDNEIGRSSELAPNCSPISLIRCMRRIQREQGNPPTIARVIHLLAKERRIKKFIVPETFPYGLAKDLRKLKLRLKVRPGPLFFAEREFKSPDEVKKVSASIMMAEVGMAEAIQALKNSKIGKDAKLVHRGLPFTAERLRSIIDTAVFQAGGLPNQTIVACGRQSFDFQKCGAGPLRANRPVVIRVLVRSQKTGYHGVITRTFVKGHASEPLRRMHETVRSAQDLAINTLHAGTMASDVHLIVQKHFEQAGYRTSRSGKHCAGFLHDTGNGLGLEISEPPAINAENQSALRPGHVVAIGPGLYYPQIGGVRLEDVLVITNNGPHNLTRFEKTLEV